MELQNRVAVVTGAASGIGRATAFALAEKGCGLALVDVNEERLEATAAALAGRPIDASTHIVDVASREQMARLVEEVLDHHGQVHILINNAGVVTLGNFEDQSYKDLEWIVGINLWGVLHGCKLFLPYLKQADRAHIVNVVSSAGLLAPPRRSAYALTKFAVRGFGECLRQELSRYDIGVTAIYPLIVRTNISQTTRWAGASVPTKASNPLRGQADTPETVAALIVRAIERNQARVLIGAKMRLLDLGKRLWPVAFDDILGRYLEK
jgi:short-subunit dehydrogenase